MSRFFKWINAWIDIFDSIICIITFGCIYPSNSWRFILWHSMRKAKKKYEVKKDCAILDEMIDEN